MQRALKDVCVKLQWLHIKVTFEGTQTNWL